MQKYPAFLITNEFKSNFLKITKINEVYIRIDCEPVIRQELSEYFTFSVPGAKFSPAFKNKMWDGKIRLYDVNKCKIYSGLLNHVLHFAKERDYQVEVDSDVRVSNPISDNKIQDFISSLGLKYSPRDYQVSSLKYCVENERSLILSPTGSGKSLIIYLLSKYYQNEKILLIVPTTSLVYQMKSDFVDYGENEKNIHCIVGGEEKNTNRRITISTWQSIYKEKKKYFSQYSMVLGDECHLFKAKSLTSIMTKLEDCRYRFGFTGTLDGSETNKLVLQGLFGNVKQFVKTKELIDNEHLSDLKIKCLVLQYAKDECRYVSKCKYSEEMDFLVSNERRNKFIRNLAISCTGNTLCLFSYVEKHGKVLYDLIQSAAKDDRKVFLVSGETDAKTREDIRNIVEEQEDAIIIASYGTFSTGINIRNLHNVIFASPSKSRIRNLQSIGRGLRTSKTKKSANLFDIADDLRHGGEPNYTLNHFRERINLYNSEEFDYVIHNIKI